MFYWAVHYWQEISLVPKAVNTAIEATLSIVSICSGGFPLHFNYLDLTNDLVQNFLFTEEVFRALLHTIT